MPWADPERNRIEASKRAKNRTPEQKRRASERAAERYREKIAAMTPAQLQRWKKKRANTLRAWIAKNRLKFNSRQRAHYQKNRERLAAARRDYYWRHPERCRQQALDYAKRNAKKRSDYSKKYRKKNHARIIANIKLWQRKNSKLMATYYLRYGAKVASSKIKARNKKAKRQAWRKKNRSKLVVQHNNAGHRRRARLKNCVLGDQHAVSVLLRTIRSAKKIPCHYCGRNVPKSLRTVDHLIPIVRGGAHAPENLVHSCKRCNCTKGKKTLDEFVVWCKKWRPKLLAKTATWQQQRLVVPT